MTQMNQLRRALAGEAWAILPTTLGARVEVAKSGAFSDAEISALIDGRRGKPV